MMRPLLPSIVAPHQLEAMFALALRAPPGDFAEVGVFGGGSAEVLYRVTEAQGRTLHLFDTFAGTPNHIEGLDKHKPGPEFVYPNAEEKIGMALPHAKLYVGEYPATHPADLPELAFIHCDCDQYLSYRAVIETLWPLVIIGGMMLFDDYPYLEGARKAVEETWAPGELKDCLGRKYVVKTS